MLSAMSKPYNSCGWRELDTFIIMTMFIVQIVKSCELADVPGMPEREGEFMICFVTSKDDGSFLFPAIPTGKYTLVSETVSFQKSKHKLSMVYLIWFLTSTQQPRYNATCYNAISDTTLIFLGSQIIFKNICGAR